MCCLVSGSPHKNGSVQRFTTRYLLLTQSNRSCSADVTSVSFGSWRVAEGREPPGEFRRIVRRRHSARTPSPQRSSRPRRASPHCRGWDICLLPISGAAHRATRRIDALPGHTPASFSSSATSSSAAASAGSKPIRSSESANETCHTNSHTRAPRTDRRAAFRACRRTTRWNSGTLPGNQGGLLSLTATMPDDPSPLRHRSIAARARQQPFASTHSAARYHSQAGAENPAPHGRARTPPGKNGLRSVRS
jgi:hypothetical protein